MKLALFSIGLSALLLSGCQHESGAKAASKGGPSQAKPRNVRVASATEQRVTRSVEVSGTLAAQDRVELALKVTGRLTELNVDLGSRVKQGQVIARLIPTELQLSVDQVSAALQQARTRLGLPLDGAEDKVKPEDTSTVRQARASLTEARLKKGRAQQLFDQKLISQSDYETAVAQFQIAEGRYQDSIEEIRNRQAVLAERRSELQLAEQRLSDSVLRSPIDGAVVERQASVGQFIAAGAPVVTVMQLHPLRLRLPVPERAAANVRMGQRVKIRADGDSQDHWGTVARISPAIDESNRTLMVEAEIPNQQALLRPGAFVRAELITEGDQPAVFVPVTALVTFAGVEKVITVDNGKSVEKTVRTGRRTAERVEIAEGLKPGEQVVIRPGTLIGGQPVTIAR